MTLDEAVALARTNPDAIWVGPTDARQLLDEASALCWPPRPPAMMEDVAEHFAHNEVTVHGVPVRLLEIV